MTKAKTLTAVTKDDLLRIFSEIDNELQKYNQALSVTVIGGVSIILQGMRDRSTMDIDITNGKDAALFQKICSGMGVPVDIVTVASTVDFAHAPKVNIFQGKVLTVDSITAEDLIRLKLERFYKQDPEDIYAIIEKTALPCERFYFLVRDMLPCFIGNPRELLLSALIVAERMYPDRAQEFKMLLAKHP